jgi:hypothetical protein
MTVQDTLIENNPESEELNSREKNKVRSVLRERLDRKDRIKSWTKKRHSEVGSEGKAEAIVDEILDHSEEYGEDRVIITRVYFDRYDEIVWNVRAYVDEEAYRIDDEIYITTQPNADRERVRERVEKETLEKLRTLGTTIKVINKGLEGEKPLYSYEVVV